MKSDTLKVGVSKPVDFAVEVSINEAENVHDVLTLSKLNPIVADGLDKASPGIAYLAGRFMRGHRITLQQDSGARELVESMIRGKSTAQLRDAEFIDTVKKAVQNCVNGFDPLAERSRGGRPPKVVILDPKELEKRMRDPQALQDYLNSFGLRTEVTAG